MVGMTATDDGRIMGGWNAWGGRGKAVKTKTPSANRRGITMSKAGNPARYFYNFLLTIFLKSCDEVLSDELCRATFDLVALDHVYQLSIFK